MAKIKLLKDLNQKEIKNEIRETFINSISGNNDAIRVLISNDDKTQKDIEKALEDGLHRYNSWIIEKIRKEIELQ